MYLKANTKIEIYSRGGGKGKCDVSNINTPDDLKDNSGSNGFLGFGIYDVSNENYLKVFRRSEDGFANSDESNESFEYTLNANRAIRIELLDSYWELGTNVLGFYINAYGTINLQKVEIIPE